MENKNQHYFNFSKLCRTLYARHLYKENECKLSLHFRTLISLFIIVDRIIMHMGGAT